MIVFNDSYESEGFLKGVSFINEHLKSYGLKVVAEFINDDALYNSIDEEFAYKLKIRIIPMNKALKALKEASISIACALDEPTEVTIKDLEHIQKQITTLELNLGENMKNYNLTLEQAVGKELAKKVRKVRAKRTKVKRNLVVTNNFNIYRMYSDGTE